jgi:heptosyltransferase III
MTARSWLDPFRRFGRALLLGGFRLLPRRGNGSPLQPAQVQSILVIRTDDRLGNLLLTTPLLGAIRQHLPAARLGLLCAARRAPAVEGTGLYDELWRFEKRDLFRRPWRFVAFFLRLRRARYQVVIEAGHFHAFSWTASAIALFSGALVRIGHRRGESERVLTHAVDRLAENEYDAQAKLELLAPLGVTTTELPPLRTELGRGRAAEFSELMGDRSLLINVGGRKADHRFPPELFAQAAAALGTTLGLSSWVVFGPGEEGLARGALGLGARLLPPTDLEGLAASFRAAKLVLTSDSGPLHLAVAVGVPTVAVFLKPGSGRWARASSRLVAVEVGEMAQPAAVARIVQEGLNLMGKSSEPGRGVEPL